MNKLNYRLTPILFLLVFCSADVAVSEPRRTGRLITHGSALDNGALGVAVDREGSIILAGYSERKGSKGGMFGREQAVYLAKHSKGGVGWRRMLGGGARLNAIDIEVDKEGNSFVVGYCPLSESACNSSFGVPALTGQSKGLANGFLLKYSAAGKGLWARYCSGCGKSKVGVGPDGASVYVANYHFGRRSGGFFGGSGNERWGAKELSVSKLRNDQTLVVKTAPDGSFLWARGVSSFTSDVDVGADGSIYIVGGPSDYPVTLFDLSGKKLGEAKDSFGKSDAFLVKLSADGQYKWGKRMGGKELYGVNAVDVTEDGTVFVLGWYDKKIQFVPGSDKDSLENDSTMVWFVAKYDSGGNFVKCVGLLNAGVLELASINNDEVIVAGDLKSTKRQKAAAEHFELFPASNLRPAGFIGRLSLDQGFRWQSYIDPAGVHEPLRIWAVAVSSAEEPVIAGSLRGRIDLGPLGGGKSHIIASQTVPSSGGSSSKVTSDIIAVQLSKEGKYVGSPGRMTASGDPANK